MAEKLEPCPFCGGTAVECDGEWGYDMRVITIQCDCCLARARTASYPLASERGKTSAYESAIAAWNRRSPPPAVEGGWRDKPTNANNMIGTRWRHKKRGSEYIVVDGMAEVQVSEGHELTDYECVVVYKGRDGRHWVRPRAEFLDGRFEALPNPPTGEKP